MDLSLSGEGGGSSEPRDPPGYGLGKGSGNKEEDLKD